MTTTASRASSSTSTATMPPTHARRKSHGRSTSTASLSTLVGKRSRSSGDLVGDGGPMGQRSRSKVGIAAMSTLEGPAPTTRPKHGKKDSHEGLAGLTAGPSQPRRRPREPSAGTEADDEGWVSASSSVAATPVPTPPQLRSPSRPKFITAASDESLGQTPRPSAEYLAQPPTPVRQPTISVTSPAPAPVESPSLQAVPEAMVPFPTTNSPTEMPSPPTKPSSPPRTRPPVNVRRTSIASTTTSMRSRAPAPLSLRQSVGPAAPRVASEAVQAQAMSFGTPVTSPVFGHPRATHGRTASLASQRSVRRDESMSDASRMLRDVSELAERSPRSRRRVVSNTSTDGGGAASLGLLGRIGGLGGSIRNLASLATQPAPLVIKGGRPQMTVEERKHLVTRFVTSPEREPARRPRYSRRQTPEGAPTPRADSPAYTYSRSHVEIEPLPHEPSTFFHPRASSVSLVDDERTDADVAENIRKWARALGQEADRIDRCHESVRRFHDPMAESFARVLARRQKLLAAKQPAEPVSQPARSQSRSRFSLGRSFSGVHVAATQPSKAPTRPSSLQRSKTAA